jgi:GTP pyrophosphokinase
LPAETVVAPPLPVAVGEPSAFVAGIPTSGGPARTLPWERSSDPASFLVPVLERYHQRWPGREDDMIRRAYNTARVAHEPQRRKSGEPYILHPLAVAMVIAELGLDDHCIAAALLHDAVEDTGLTLDDIEIGFGPDVAALVDGVTKLDALNFDTKESMQAESTRKMLVAMARDLRVLILKLADRLHNMRTLSSLRPEKQQAIARETLEVYAPLAHRLGMQETRQLLEDLAFAALYPSRYAELSFLVEQRAAGRAASVADTCAQVADLLRATELDATVYGRRKHLYSIYEKTMVKGKSFEEIFDLVGIRVIVDSVRNCYAALGIIHGRWQPLPGRFKDYIAMPKFNSYQSLHTTVLGPGNALLEVQIRTREMDEIAEHGVAAHFRYKGRGDDLHWLRNIIDWQSETADPDEFMTTLRAELELDELFVLTPKGQVITLPMGSTPIDFAYAIHTDVGNAAMGAKVNGRLVPIDRELQSGDTVEIFTSKVPGHGPSRDWLNIVVTAKARSKIRQWFAQRRRVDAIDTGTDEVVEALRREGLAARRLVGSDDLLEVADEMGYQDLEALYFAVGERHVSAQAVAQRLARRLRDGEEEQPVSTRFEPRARSDRSDREASAVGVHIEGLDGVQARLAKCCHPVPGDEIMGFVTRGRGVSVHRDDCANAISLSAAQGGRLVDVEWDDRFAGAYSVEIGVQAFDRPGLLQDVAAAVAAAQGNIVSAEAKVSRDRISTLRFEIHLLDAEHLHELLRSVRSVRNVFEAARVLPGSRAAAHQ